MATDKESKTEQPTDRRKEDAEKKGDIPRSKDLSATVALFSTLIFFTLFMPTFSKVTINFWKKYFSLAGDVNLTTSYAFSVGRDFFDTYLVLVVPLFILLLVVAIGIEIAQSGGLKIIPDNFKIKWEKVFFITEIPKGIKKVMISVQALFELFKAIVKVIFIFGIAYYTLIGEIPIMMSLPSKSLTDILDYMGKIFIKLSFNIIIFMVILSVLDYLWQKQQYIKKLKMSKQDVKDEFKQMEGDPKVKGKQKQIQFQRAMQRMMSEVPQADVVITNPTHFAVALKYEFKKMHSPKLLAKGQDLIAQKMKEVAKQHNVPVVENPPVARAVFAGVDIGQFIPEELFKPVAEILAYIYKLKGKKAG
jgi:flagellar biosynthesis protein FlhB